MLALDGEYWNEQARHPAAAWTAAGSPQWRQLSKWHWLICLGAEVAEVHKDEPFDISRKRQSNRDKRLARAKRVRAEREELDGLRRRSWTSDGKQHNNVKGKGKGKTW